MTTFNENRGRTGRADRLSGRLLAWAGSILSVLAAIPSIMSQVAAHDSFPEKLLKAIYLEVKELGPYPGETFIKHDFFLGPADDDSYKKEHIVILIQTVEGGERLLVQVTEMKNRPNEPRVQLAGRTRTISCSVRASGRLTVLRSDYSDKEIRRQAADILRAVREKKKLLREYAPPPADRQRLASAAF